MKVAEIIVSVGRFHEQSRIGVGFDNRDKAEAEFRRIAALLEKRGARENDLPKTIEVKGIEEMAFQLEDLVSLRAIVYLTTQAKR